MKIKVEVELKDVINDLAKELEGMCYCNFQKHKKDLEKFREVINRRWDEPVDPGCIE